MSETAEPLNVRLKLSATCPNGTRTHTAVAGHEVITDEPEFRGGTNIGAAPVQTYLASLLGCINVLTNACARDQGVEVTSIEIEMEAEVDRRGILLIEPVTVPFPSITLNIYVKTNATDDQWKQVVDCYRKSCPIAVAIQASGTEIHENWNLIRD